VSCSYSEIFYRYNLSIYSLYFYLLLRTGIKFHNINTRYNANLHLPLANLTYQKGIFYAESRIYNYLPSIIKDLSNDGKHFKTALKRHTLDNSFYGLEEHFNQNM